MLNLKMMGEALYPKKRAINNHGQTQTALMNLYRPNKISQLQELVTKSEDLIVMHKESGIDSLFIQEASNAIITEYLDNIINFDRYTGKIILKSGVTLEELFDTFLNEGYILSGHYIDIESSIGGLIAKGELEQIEWLDIITPEGLVKKISPNKDSDIFKSTISGYGLTGIITKACLNLQKVSSSIVKVNRTKCENLSDIFKLFEERKGDYRYAWIDTFATGVNLGRGLFYSAKHSSSESLEGKLISIPKLKIPFHMPKIITNPAVLSRINELKYKYSKDIKEYQTSLKDFLYPFSQIQRKDKLYGRQGYYSLTIVIPEKDKVRILTEILEIISSNFISSINSRIVPSKSECIGYLTSPIKEGYKVLIDVPYQLGIEEILSELEEKVLKMGCFLPLINNIQNFETDFIKKIYKNIDKFMSIIKEIDPKNKMDGQKLIQGSEDEKN